MVAPHRSCRHDTAADGAPVFKYRLGAYADKDFRSLARLHDIRDIKRERQEEIEVFPHLGSVHINLALSGHSLEIEFYPLAVPVLRHRHGPAHPCLLHLVPLLRI